MLDRRIIANPRSLRDHALILAVRAPARRFICGQSAYTSTYSYAELAALAQSDPNRDGINRADGQDEFQPPCLIGFRASVAKPPSRLDRR